MKSTCWDTRATDSLIKSGQKDTEASIVFAGTCFGTSLSLSIMPCEKNFEKNLLVLANSHKHLFIRPKADPITICNFCAMSLKPCSHKDSVILASVSFWPLLIIELVPRSVPARLIIC